MESCQRSSKNPNKMSCGLVLGSELNGSFSSWSGPHIKTLIEKARGLTKLNLRLGVWSANLRTQALLKFSKEKACLKPGWEEE